MNESMANETGGAPSTSSLLDVFLSPGDPPAISIVDLSALRELENLRLESGAGLLAALVAIFFESSSQIERLNQEFAQGHLDVVRALAHEFKSCSANLGLVRLKCVCHKIERAKSAEGMRPAIALLQAEFDLAKLHLEKVVGDARLPRSA